MKRIKIVLIPLMLVFIITILLIVVAIFMLLIKPGNSYSLIIIEFSGAIFLLCIMILLCEKDKGETEREKQQISFRGFLRCYSYSATRNRIL